MNNNLLTIKMSKSKGNMVYPMDLAARYSVDAVRYYLTKEEEDKDKEVQAVSEKFEAINISSVPEDSLLREFLGK